MFFGKRQKKIKSTNDKHQMPIHVPEYNLTHPGPDDDGVSRVFPKTLWDGESGQFLREMDFTPDDPTNIINSNPNAPLNYEVQPDYIIPLRFYDDPFLKKLMDKVDFHPNIKENLVWYFADHRTVAAFCASSENVRQLFMQKKAFSERTYKGRWRVEQDNFALTTLLEMATQDLNGELPGEAVKYAFWDFHRFLNNSCKNYSENETPPKPSTHTKFDELDAWIRFGGVPTHSD